MPSDTLTRALTPRQLAAYLGVGTSKVLAWVRAGKLRAVNLASGELGRPRWRILPADLAAFLDARQAVQPAPERRRLPRRPAGWIDYYPDGKGGDA